MQPVTDQPRPPPKRHALAGCSALVLFVLVTGILSVRSASKLSLFSGLHGSSSRTGESDEVQGLAQEHKLQLVRIGRSARELTCLATYVWNAPDPECVKRVVAHGEDLEGLVSPELLAITHQQFPEVSDAVGRAQTLARPARDLGRMLQALEQNRHPMTQQMAANVATQSVLLAQKLDELLSLDDPKWDALLHQSEARAQADDDEEDDDTETETPRPQADPKPVPAPAPVVAMAEATAPAPAAQPASDAVIPPPPKASAASEPPPAGPGLVVRGLIIPLVDVREALRACGHDPNHVADAAWRTRTRLEALEPLLAAYRETKREGAAEAQATAFARQVDQARSRLLRAATELSSAARQSLAHDAERLGEDPFLKADQLLAQAEKDVAQAEALAQTAP